MPEPFCIGIADLTAELHPLFDTTKPFCKDYVVPNTAPDMVAVSTEEGVQYELALAPDAPLGMTDTVCLFRQIAEQLPAFDAFVFHGAAIEYDGKAYLFAAPSGTGKSTHIRLWKQHLGDKVRIVNGDKPVLRLTKNGVNVCSTPWAGKEGWHRNCIVPLGGICLLRRGEVNRIAQTAPLTQFDALLRQVYHPRNGDAWDKTLQLLDTALARVPFYVLDCTISTQAVEVALHTLTGGNNHENS